MENEKTFGSVEAFLKSHPQATLDLTTPMGFVHLTPEQREELLDGGKYLPIQVYSNRDIW